MTETVLVLGSNLGDRAKNIFKAIQLLGELGNIEKVSSLYETAPWGFVNQGNFLNCAISMKTKTTPEELLDEIHKIEKLLGRERGIKWGPRVIDIDIALMGDLVLDSPELTIPHEGLGERDFFLVPIVEIEPDAIDPRDGRKLAELINEKGKITKTIFAKFEEENWRSIITSA